MCVPVKCVLVEKISPMIHVRYKKLSLDKNWLHSWESLIFFVGHKKLRHLL